MNARKRKYDLNLDAPPPRGWSHPFRQDAVRQARILASFRHLKQRTIRERADGTWSPTGPKPFARVRKKPKPPAWLTTDNPIPG